jgi:Na+-translocating ferredoxin:NAD+ oxidoreductase subunit B
MNGEIDIYRELQKHLDKMPVGFPATESGVEIRILKHLFTSEEAKISLSLSAIPEPLERIYRQRANNNLSASSTDRSSPRYIFP